MADRDTDFDEGATPVAAYGGRAVADGKSQGRGAPYYCCGRGIVPQVLVAHGSRDLFFNPFGRPLHYG